LIKIIINGWENNEKRERVGGYSLSFSFSRTQKLKKEVFVTAKKRYKERCHHE